MKFGTQEAAVVVSAVALSGLAIAGVAAGSLLIATVSVVLLIGMVILLLLVVLRRVSARASTESLKQLERRVDELSVTSATDAAANHREMLAAVEKLAGEVRPPT